MKILILSKTEPFVLNMMRCLDGKNVECHVFGQGAMRTVALSRYCRRFQQCDLGTPQHPNDAVVDEINRYCLRNHIDMVVPGDYDAVYAFARVKDRLADGIRPFLCAPAETLEMLDDKWKFANLLESLQLPYPRTLLVTNPAELKSVDLGFPRIVKPLRGNRIWSGGIGTSYVKENMEAYLACEETLEATPLLVQEYIPGPDVDLSLLACDGKIVAWTMQKWLDPVTLQFFNSDALYELGRRVVEATRYSGVAHFDLRIDERDGVIKFIECNPRFWGSLRASMWNGVNFLELGLALSQGQDVDVAPVSKDIRYVLPSSILSKLLKGRWSVLKELPQATRDDLKQIMFDPLPLAAAVLGKLG